MMGRISLLSRLVAVWPLLIALIHAQLEPFFFEVNQIWAPDCPRGEDYQFDLPARFQNLPNIRSPRYTFQQRICNLARFGGNSQFNLGGFCYTPIVHSRRLAPRMGFNRRDPKPDNSELSDSRTQYPRLEMFCALRCQCSPQTKNIHAISFTSTQTTSAVNLLRFLPGFEINLETPTQYHRSPLTHTNALIRLDEHKTDLTYPSNDFHGLAQRWIGLAMHNWLECDSSQPFPPFPLQTNHLPWSRFRTFQHLCAAELSGGHTHSNAGGICLLSKGRRIPQFLNEFVPNDSWTSYRDWRAAWAIRVWCWTKCSCKTFMLPGMKPGQTGAIPYFDDAEVQIAEGSISVVQKIRESNDVSSWTYQRKVQLLPDPYKDPEAAAQCDEAKGDYCGADWPTEILGPNPDDAATTTDPVAGLDFSEVLGGETGSHDPLSSSSPDDKSFLPVGATCGSQCNSNRDCVTGRAQDADCACRTKPTSLMGANSGMMVFQVAFCVSLAVAGSSSRSVVRRRSTMGNGLNRRDVDGHAEDMEMLMKGAACACNATYVSVGCCGSDDGIIWEHGDFKLGILSL